MPRGKPSQEILKPRRTTPLRHRTHRSKRPFPSMFSRVLTVECTLGAIGLPRVSPVIVVLVGDFGTSCGRTKPMATVV